jgi:ATP/maltotriose-dependent transcriptional regulator MalT
MNAAHAPAASRWTPGKQVPIERHTPMSFDSRLAILIPGTEAPGSAQPHNSASYALTARERDILALISQGLSNKRAARALKISPETVKSHVKSIFSKLAVSARSAAVFRAGSLGLLRPPEPTLKENTIASSEG